MKKIIIIGIVILLGIFTATTGEAKQLNIKEIIITTARRYGLQPSIALAICEIESSFNPNAVNPSDPSYGLFQMTIPTAAYYAGREVLKDDLMNPELSATLGCAFLKDLISKYDLERAIQSYNLGETRYSRGKRASEYLNKFLKAREKYLIYD